MNATQEQMAALEELFASIGISRERLEEAFNFQTRDDAHLLRNLDFQGNFEANQRWKSPFDTVAQMEAKLKAAKAKYERKKTAPDPIKKLRSPASRAQLIRENELKRFKDQSSIQPGQSLMYTSICGIDRKFSGAQLEDLERGNSSQR